MQITIQIEAEALKDGNFQPKITIVEDHGFSKDHVGYMINETCLTREQALERARVHAMDEAQRVYGSEVEVNIEEIN